MLQLPQVATRWFLEAECQVITRDKVIAWGAKLPIDGVHTLLVIILPTQHLPTGFLNGGNIVSQTLPRQHRKSIPAMLSQEACFGV